MTFIDRLTPEQIDQFVERVFKADKKFMYITRNRGCVQLLGYFDGWSYNYKAILRDFEVEEEDDDLSGEPIINYSMWAKFLNGVFPVEYREAYGKKCLNDFDKMIKKA